MILIFIVLVCFVVYRKNRRSTQETELKSVFLNRSQDEYHRFCFNVSKFSASEINALYQFIVKNDYKYKAAAGQAISKQ